MDQQTISISLPVQNLAMSMAFYETLGFDLLADESAKDFAVVQDGETVIGLYHGIELLPAAIVKFGWNPDIDPVNVVAACPALRSWMQ